MKTLWTALALTLVAALPSAQITVPATSPRAVLTQEVGLAQVTIDYGRPGVRGRQVFGGLEPLGAVWRTGANASTKISFDRDVQLGGQDVPAGTYALYTIPDQNSWTLILSRNTSLWGSNGYDESEDLMRLRCRVRRLEDNWESLTIDFRDFHVNGAELFIRWSDVEIAVPLFSDSDSIIMAQIQEQIVEADGPVDGGLYWSAARYYAENGKDLALAAQWVEEAVDQAPDAFWMVFYRAELAQRMGDAETAISWARSAHGMASGVAPNDYGYAARCEQLLADLGAEP